MAECLAMTPGDRAPGRQALRDRQARGLRAHLAGEAAEASIARRYRDRGYAVDRRRWRGKGGEIDLILRNGAALVFVEVKSGPDIATAASRLGPRQQARLFAAAGGFLASEPAGLETEARFDVALVDGRGGVEIIENAFTS